MFWCSPSLLLSVPISLPLSPITVPSQLWLFSLTTENSQHSQNVYGVQSSITGTALRSHFFEENALSPTAVKCQQLLSVRWGFMTTVPLHDGIWSSLIFHRSCVCCHNHYAFISETALLYCKNSFIIVTYPKERIYNISEWLFLATYIYMQSS